MRKFLTLPAEKQNKIIEAAMNLFGEVGYKKAYISEIASASKISKALVFYYFGSKKSLYSYLVYYTGKVVMTEAQHERETAGKNFFDRAAISLRFRLNIKTRYPAMNLFIESVFNEDEPEVSADIERLKAIATDMHSKISLEPGEEKIFKNGIEPNQIINLLDEYTNGVVYGWDGSQSIDNAMMQVNKCFEMLKNNLCSF